MTARSVSIQETISPTHWQCHLCFTINPISPAANPFTELCNNQTCGHRHCAASCLLLDPRAASLYSIIYTDALLPGPQRRYIYACATCSRTANPLRHVLSGDPADSCCHDPRLAKAQTPGQTIAKIDPRRQSLRDPANLRRWQKWMYCNDKPGGIPTGEEYEEALDAFGNPPRPEWFWDWLFGDEDIGLEDRGAVGGGRGGQTVPISTGRVAVPESKSGVDVNDEDEIELAKMIDALKHSPGFKTDTRTDTSTSTSSHRQATKATPPVSKKPFATTTELDFNTIREPPPPATDTEPPTSSPSPPSSSSQPGTPRRHNHSRRWHHAQAYGGGRQRQHERRSRIQDLRERRGFRAWGAGDRLAAPRD